MSVLKYIAQNRVIGLLPMRRLADGQMIHPEIKTDEVIELEFARAEPLVVCGALIPQNRIAYQELGGRPFNPNPMEVLRSPVVDGKVKVNPVA